MKCDKNCPKCNKPILTLWHFHEPDYKGIQAIVYHNKRSIIDLFGEHEVFTDACFLTEFEYQALTVV